MTKIKIGIIGGSGLEKADILENVTEKSVDTPFGKPSDALKCGTIDGVPCVLLNRHDRNHGVSPSKINFRANIWALKKEQCTHILAVTACGSLQEHIKPGDIVVLDQFIDRTSQRATTFYDSTPNGPIGVCHIPMQNPFCPATRKVLIDTAKSLNIPYHTAGTVVCIEGPRYSSKAESLMFRQWGGHVINMSSVPEVNLARELGLCYASMALVTDYDCWRENAESVSVDSVMACFRQNAVKATNILRKAVKTIYDGDWTNVINGYKEAARTAVMLPDHLRTTNALIHID